MTSNHQQGRRRRETRGHRYDPVDRTGDNLRTPGLKRCLTWRATSAEVITGVGPSNKAEPRILATCANLLVVAPGHKVVIVTPVPRSSWPIARPKLSVGLGCIVHCHARTGLECSQGRKKHDLATLARHHLRQPSRVNSVNAMILTCSIDKILSEFS